MLTSLIFGACVFLYAKIFAFAIKVMWKSGIFFAYGVVLLMSVVSAHSFAPAILADGGDVIAELVVSLVIVAWWSYRWIYSKVTGENARHIWQVFRA